MTRDPLDDLGTAGFEASGLNQLLSDLASPAVDRELAGRQAALSMFRAVRAEQAAATVIDGAGAASVPTAAGVPSAAQTRVLRPATGKPSRRPAKSTRRSAAPVKKARVGGRLVACALFLAFAGSFAAAGYAAVLPAPLQRVAHQLLGVVGVPDPPDRQSHVAPSPPATGAGDHHSPAGSPSSSRPPSSRPSHGKSPKPKHKSHSPSPHPSSPGRSTGPVKIAIAAAQQEITAGQSVQITASLTRNGKVATSVKVSLLELTAGQSGHGAGAGAPARSGWQVAGSAVTDGHGDATFTVRDLTTNARFRVTGPAGSVSKQLTIVVAPPITATLGSGSRPNLDLLVVSSPLGQRGDLVDLEVDANGQWSVIHQRPLNKNGQVTFNVPLRKVSETYRVVLAATGAHAESVSQQVSAPARPHHAKGPPG